MPRVRAPELPQDRPWLNTAHPLTLRSLRGRFVLLDFWTYGCINCLHVLPTMKYLEQKYKDSLTVIGVHSAKFTNEQELNSIRQAVLRYDVEHPVLVDSEFEVWQQYAVRAWPTIVIIDPAGYVRHSLTGEVSRDRLEALLDELFQNSQTQETLRLKELSFTLEKQQQTLTSSLAFPGKVLVGQVGTEVWLFVADSGHHRLVIATLTGEVRHVIGTGEPGLVDGTFAEAKFFAPQGMSLDSDQLILYVADAENHALRRVDLRQQRVDTIAGTGIQNRLIRPQQGLALETPLNSPWDVEKVGDRLFIAMAGPHQIWIMHLLAGFIETYAGSGAEGGVDGEPTQAAFAQPSGISTDGQELYVADSEISAIRGIGLGPNYQVRTICGSGELFSFGDVDGIGEAARLQHCLGITYAQGNLWVADTYNHKIKRVALSTQHCQTLVGNGQAGHQDRQGTDSSFAEPSGLSIWGDRLYVADTNNHAIRCVALDTLTVSTLTFPGLCSPTLCWPDFTL
ncbi:redoxin domain-containing protein [Trichocoleus sp. FACHB-591]|uniref:thioredoxin-like domain-containing protein n=1 Tax=Trichocoleus sp. FACHB-591 TaxID=2692872 RepID=UPI001684FB21|nr:thioredoxin-like domain-containing protein [Trichocoleus sp. FACHB-591]MBD2094776.1 redoxin domain-containing protein [Trichocoleus sp. FACHB-591]